VSVEQGVAAGFTVAVGRCYFGEGAGYIELLVNGEKHLLQVETKGRSILLSLGEAKGIPLTKARLLLEQPAFEGLGRAEKYKLRTTIERAVYKLVNSFAERAKALAQQRVGDWKIVVYEDGTVAAYGPNVKRRLPLHDLPQLKAELLAAMREAGWEIEDAAKAIEGAFGELEKVLKVKSVVRVGETVVRYADGMRLRRCLAVGEQLFYVVWIYGEVEESGAAVKGAYPVVLKSDGLHVEVVESVPFAAPAGVIPLPLELIRNAVLDTNEFTELLGEIERINRGEAAPPTWREVFDEIVSFSRRFVGLEEKYRSVVALANEHNYLFDAFVHTVYLCPSGPSGSGKRNLREFIGALSPSVKVTKPSEAAMARVINELKPVMIIDETNLSTEEWRKFLNAGTQKGTLIIRCDTENPNRIIPLDPYGPKAFVMQPQELAQLAPDTRNRTIVIPMQRQKGSFEREIKREDAWPIVKKLYLLSLYRWKEYLEAYRQADPIVSRYFGGHARDKWLHFIALALLCGPDVLETVVELACQEYGRKEDLDPLVGELVAGLLRLLTHVLSSDGGELLDREDPVATLLAEEGVIVEKSEDGQWLLKTTPKAVAVANGVEDDRGYTTRLGQLLRRGELPFVAGFEREGKKRRRTYYVDVAKLASYVRDYEIEVPEDADLNILKEKLGVTIELARPRPKDVLSALLGRETFQGGLFGAKVSGVSEVSAQSFEPIVPGTKISFSGREGIMDASRTTVRKEDEMLMEEKGEVRADTLDTLDTFGQEKGPWNSLSDVERRLLEACLKGENIYELAKKLLPDASPKELDEILAKVVKLWDEVGA